MVGGGGVGGGGNLIVSEFLWNFLLVVIKVTKQSCCHGDCISRNM